MSLILRNVNKSFGQKTILNNFSYEFTKTGIYAIVGESGIGKTTLLRLISGLDKDYSGEIIGGGAQNVSYAFQEHRLFPTLSALENVLVVNNAEVSTARKKLFEFGFAVNDLDLLPSELSGGMKQRVSLVRAIMKDTPILILDEPTKELDSELRNHLYSLLLKEGKKRLVIIVTHNSEDISKLSAVKINL